MASVTYSLQILPSPSTFVERVEFYAAIDGAMAAKLVNANGVSDFPSNTTFGDFEFPIGASVQWFVRVVGDNLTQADSQVRTFTAINEAQVQPATAVSEAFVKYNP